MTDKERKVCRHCGTRIAFIPADVTTQEPAQWLHVSDVGIYLHCNPEVAEP